MPILQVTPRMPERVEFPQVYRLLNVSTRALIPVCSDFSTTRWIFPQLLGRGMMPPDPPQLPEGKEENSLVTSPFSAFEAVPRGESFWCRGRSERVGIVGQAGELVERELVEEGRTGRETANCFWMEFSRQGFSQRTNAPSEFSL